MVSKNKTWWKEGIVYQIYPRSFYDSNGDGIGDLTGIIKKLDYIKSLGVDIIWLCPVYESPNDDNGYDISNYCQIMTEFGTMEHFDDLLLGIHRRKMKLIMDLVPNHSSDEHKWFKESRKSKHNPYRDYYFWRKGKNGQPPNNWPSFFGGSAWAYDDQTNEYYLHLFSKKQPDLNWENPELRKEIYKIIDFWFKKGIDGFRMDVITVISKDLAFPDIQTNNFIDIVDNQYANGPRVHEFLREMNQKVLKNYDVMTVGEGPGIKLTNCLDYVAADRNELNMIFHFDHMHIDHGPGGKYDPVSWDLPSFKRIFSLWDERLQEKGWGSIFLGNHDYPRIVSRFGNDQQYREESAKLLATMLLSLRGTSFIYQGDEIGMTNVSFPTIDDYRDLEGINAWNEALAKGDDMDGFLEIIHRQGRDNARTPIHWDDTPNGGFTKEEPWIKVNPNYRKINIKAQESNLRSVLNYYRAMIEFRKGNPTLVYGDYACLYPEHTKIYAYERWDEYSAYLVLLNFSDDDVRFESPISDSYKLKMNNYTSRNEKRDLRPWEAKVFLKE
jgi:oligo-1,6-glucosidase